MPGHRRYSIDNPIGLWQDSSADYEPAGHGTAPTSSVYRILRRVSPVTAENSDVRLQLLPYEVGRLLQEFINIRTEDRQRGEQLDGKLHISKHILEELDEYLVHSQSMAVQDVNTTQLLNRDSYSVHDDQTLESLASPLATDGYGRRYNISYADLDRSDFPTSQDPPVLEAKDLYATRESSGRWLDGMLNNDVTNGSEADQGRQVAQTRSSSQSSWRSDGGPEELCCFDDIDWDIVDELKSFSFSSPRRGRRLTRPDFPPMSPRAVACKLWPKQPDFSIPMEKNDILHLQFPINQTPDKTEVTSSSAQKENFHVPHNPAKPKNWFRW